jgi:tripartite-type tricarboxylate transporter receptor subunit TctC
MKCVPRLIVAGCLALLFMPGVHAQYPNRAIRFVVPFPPGGGADFLARVVGQQMGQAMGQQWVVDNRGGADGALAGVIVAKAAPDGYTIFLGTNSPLSAVPAMRRTPPYDPVADFTPIGMLGRFTFFLFVKPDLPARTVNELVAHARSNPGKFNYGTGNTVSIVASAQFKMLAKLDIAQIPYKGDAPATTDLLGGQIQMAFMTPVPALAMVKEGRLRLLATLLPQRSSLAPEVPTIAEAGMPGVSIMPWLGTLGPAKLPAEIVTRLSRELNTVLARTDVREPLARQGFEVQPSTPAELAATVKDQLQLWKRVVREAQIPVE